VSAAAAERATRLAEVDGPQTLGDAFRVFLRYPSPRILLALLAASLAGRALLGAPGAGDLAVLAAVVVWWPVQEWTLHVFALHLPPRRWLGRTIEFEFARRHRIHHQEPWRYEWIFLPVWVHLLAPLLVLLFLAILPAALAATAMAGFVAMALQYEWTHFLVHTRYAPRSARAREIFRNHRLHHFKNEHYWFGFTVVLVDRLLGTAPEPETVETSPTCRTLGRD